MEKLVQGVHRFHRDIFRPHHEWFQNLVSGQNPQAMFITCSDSRVIPDLITQSQPGDLFALRNAGNLVPPNGAAHGSGEAGTIEYAVNFLKIEDIIVCGHTRCGAVHAVLYPETLDKLPRVRRWLSHADATREIIFSRYEHLEANPDAMWQAAVEENVLVQLQNLRTHPSVAAGLSRGNLKLHGWVYKMETGQVFTYDPSTGQFVELSHSPPVTSVDFASDSSAWRPLAVNGFSHAIHGI